MQGQLMQGQEEKDWLASLKEGDQVACNFASYGYKKSYKILHVHKVTPSGIIKTRTDSGNEYVFNKNGRERTSNRGTWSRHLSIEPLTADVFELMERDQLILKLSGVTIEDLSTPLLRKFVEVLEEDE